MDLFENEFETTSGTPSPHNSPLAVRMRPRNLDEVLGQKNITQPGTPLARLVSAEDSSQAATSVVLWGPPGTGKTTLAYLVAASRQWNFVELSAVSSGVKDIRAVISEAKRSLATQDKVTVLFVDEVHRFSKSQQDALLPAVENRWVVLIAATTENPVFSVIAPLLSRSITVTLESLSTEDIVTLLDRAILDERGLGGKVRVDEGVTAQIANLVGGDARKALTILEAAATSAMDRHTSISADIVETVTATAALKYGVDDHYDVISAFIKSMRGSDPQATVYYLARMIVAGEDPRFIARRIMIAAAEDVGLADPTVLTVATSAAQAVALVGMPEARIILSEAAIAVAVAPKSNASYNAINAAISEVKSGAIGEVPDYLRDGHRPKSSKGKVPYLYAHDYPYAVAPQTYLPQGLESRNYYAPSDRGFEKQVTERMLRVQKLRNLQ